VVERTPEAVVAEAARMPAAGVAAAVVVAVAVAEDGSEEAVEEGADPGWAASSSRAPPRSSRRRRRSSQPARAWPHRGAAQTGSGHSTPTPILYLPQIGSILFSGVAPFTP
jgi:hypothetical protein